MKNGFRIPKNEINGRNREMLGYYGYGRTNLVCNADDGCFDPDEEDEDEDE